MIMSVRQREIQVGGAETVGLIPITLMSVER